MDILRNPPLDRTLVDGIVDLWVTVANAGGAVGFVAPVIDADVRPVAEAAVARVAAGADDIVVAMADGVPVGLGFLVSNDLTLHAHYATIKRLQRHPAVRDRGVGATLLSELEVAARARGLERVVLTVRGGTGRERFYEANGYAVEAVLPRRIQVAPDDFRDEIVMGKVLDDTGERGLTLSVQRLDADLPLPRYAHPGDAGLDLHARHDVTLKPGERAVVETGVAVALPPGCVGLVHPRSGLAARHGLALVNAPGTIDEGYRGQVKVILVNLDPAEPVILARGERIAQLVVQRVEKVRVAEVSNLPGTTRGAGGFGSTGR